jgi:hypothetical protein
MTSSFVCKYKCTIIGESDILLWSLFSLNSHEYLKYEYDVDNPGHELGHVYATYSPFSAF